MFILNHQAFQSIYARNSKVLVRIWIMRFNSSFLPLMAFMQWIFTAGWVSEQDLGSRQTHWPDSAFTGIKSGTFIDGSSELFMAVIKLLLPLIWSLMGLSFNGGCWANMKYLLFSQIWLVLHGLVSDSVSCISDAQHWGCVAFLSMSDEIQMCLF